MAHYLRQTGSGDPEKADYIIDIANLSHEDYQDLLNGSAIVVDEEGWSVIDEKSVWIYRLQNEWHKANDGKQWPPEQINFLKSVDTMFDDLKKFWGDDEFDQCAQRLADFMPQLAAWPGTYNDALMYLQELVVNKDIILKQAEEIPLEMRKVITHLMRGLPITRDEAYAASEYFSARFGHSADDAGWENIATFKDLVPGDIVRGKAFKRPGIVTANYGTRVTAVNTFDLTNPEEWQIRRFK